MIRNTDSDFDPTMAACEAFETVLNCVKTSNLNFCIQLSPFSANISVKKTLVKDKAGFYLSPTVTDSSSSVLQNQNVGLIKKLSELESTNEVLKLSLEKSISDNQKAYDTIQRLENEIFIKKEQSDANDCDLKKGYEQELEMKSLENYLLQEENRSFQHQRESMQTLQKQHDDEIQVLQRNLQNSETVAKRLNKKLNDDKIKRDKETKLLVKDFKSEIKSWKKNLGLERSEKIKAEKKLATVENDLKKYTSKSWRSISCQTKYSPDIPYKITAPLPPIFGSQLCYTSKTVPYMRRSLPNLSTLSWVTVTEEEILLDKAEQALNEQFDKQKRDFYEEAKNKAAAIRQIYDENAIEKLFENK